MTALSEHTHATAKVSASGKSSGLFSARLGASDGRATGGATQPSDNADESEIRQMERAFETDSEVHSVARTLPGPGAVLSTPIARAFPGAGL